MKMESRYVWSFVYSLYSLNCFQLTELTLRLILLLFQISIQVRGNFSQDVIRIGNEYQIEIDQIFAQVTTVDNFVTCEGEDGVLGLAYTYFSKHNYPGVLKNM